MREMWYNRYMDKITSRTMDKITNMKEWCRFVGGWLNRLHYKTRWRNYINGNMSYADFKEYVFITVNSIRKLRDVPEYSYNKFDEGWQYRIIAHENYSVAYAELLNLIFGWW